MHSPFLPQKPGIRGLGDLVYIVAQPVAKVIDFIAGTSITKCGKCKQRREEWNDKFPLNPN